MRYHATAAALVLLSLGSAAAADQTSDHVVGQLKKPAHLGSAALLPRALSPHGMSRLRARQSGCLSSETTCGDGCIPSSAECCDSSDGSFCPVGYYCDGPGCCEDGETCSGPAIGCPDGTELCGLSDCVLEGSCTDGSSGGGSSGGSGGSGSDEDETTTTTTTSTSDSFDSLPTSTTTTDDFADAFPTTTSSSTTDFDTSFPTDTSTTQRSLPTPTGGSIRPPSAGSSLLAPILTAFVGAVLAAAAVVSL